jgi:cell division protein FtsW
MLYLAGMQMKWIGVAFLCAAPVLYFMLRVPWRWARMLVFFNPEADPKGAGFHILQSLIAVGSGGIFGARPDGRRAEALLSARAAH